MGKDSEERCSLERREDCGRCGTAAETIVSSWDVAESGALRPRQNVQDNCLQEITKVEFCRRENHSSSSTFTFRTARKRKVQSEENVTGSGLGFVVIAADEENEVTLRILRARRDEALGRQRALSLGSRRVDTRIVEQHLMGSKERTHHKGSSYYHLHPSALPRVLCRSDPVDVVFPALLRIRSDHLGASRPCVILVPLRGPDGGARPTSDGAHAGHVQMWLSSPGSLTLVRSSTRPGPDRQGKVRTSFRGDRNGHRSCQVTEYGDTGGKDPMPGPGLGPRMDHDEAAVISISIAARRHAVSNHRERAKADVVSWSTIRKLCVDSAGPLLQGPP